MNSKKIKAFFKEPRNALIFIFGIVSLILVIVMLVGRLNSTEDLIGKDQIQLRRGDKIVTVNANGLVEYRSEKGVFYETWDPNKTDAFFSSIREKARQYLLDPPKERPVNGYEVTLWIDGELITIYLEVDDEELEKIFEEFENNGDGNLSDYFDDDLDIGVNVTPTLLPGTIAIPTLVPGVSATQTPTPLQNAGGSQGGVGQQSLPDCDLYSTQVTKRTVISNTICQTEE